MRFSEKIGYLPAPRLGLYRVHRPLERHKGLHSCIGPLRTRKVVRVRPDVRAVVFQGNNILQRDSVKGAMHSFPITRGRHHQNVECNQPFQVYGFFRKTERALRNVTIYTAFNDARSAANPTGFTALTRGSPSSRMRFASAAGSLCNRNPEMALDKEVMAGLAILA